MKVKCSECGSEGEVYTKIGIETINWCYERLRFNETKYWIVWDSWKKAYCEDCLKKEV